MDKLLEKCLLTPDEKVTSIIKACGDYYPTIQSVSVACYDQLLKAIPIIFEEINSKNITASVPPPIKERRNEGS